MTKKIKFWDAKNLLITLIVIVASIITSLILIIPSLAAYWFLANTLPIVGRLLSIVILLASLLVFGWILRKLLKTLWK